MKVVVNAVSAEMGGALAYLRNFLPALAAADGAGEYILFVQERFADEFSRFGSNIRVETSPLAGTGERNRLIFDQWALRRFAKRNGADVIFSTANFGVVRPPVPQVTSVRNAIYFSREYRDRIRAIEGRAAAAKLDARRLMVRLSCASSRVVVTPSESMRSMLLDWNAAAPERTVVIRHGFDREAFGSMSAPPDESLRRSLERRGGETLLLYPSLYGKHKNFDTLMEALGRLVRAGVNARLLLTCEIGSKSAYERRTREVMAREGVEERVTFLGSVAYRAMPRVYAAADVVVWTTFTESFGHPLLEAMASRKPVVASDIPINREMAGEAALYFAPFDASALASRVTESLDGAVGARLVARGQARVGDFSWRSHVEEFVQLFTELSQAKAGNGNG